MVSAAVHGWVLCTAVVAIATGCGPGGGNGSGKAGGGDHPSAAPVHFIGRVDTRDVDAPRCAWTYCGLSTRFRGTALDVAIGGAPGIAFQVVVDGSATMAFKTSVAQKTYRVAEGLPAGEHDVTVVRRSEAFFGASELRGFVPAAGDELVPSTPTVTRRVDFIGDSITAGYGNEGCPFSTDTENGYLSYAAIAARALGADVRIEAWSGSGIYRDGNGSTAGTMAERYDLTLPEDPTSRWDSTQWIPDAIIVNLGTNDFLRSDPGQPFVDAYVRFVRSLRAGYPNALVLCAVNGNVRIGLTIDQVVATLDDAKVERLDLAVPDWNGCDGHPSVAADHAMATQLAARLRAELGW